MLSSVYELITAPCLKQWVPPPREWQTLQAGLGAPSPWSPQSWRMSEDGPSIIHADRSGPAVLMSFGSGPVLRRFSGRFPSERSWFSSPCGAAICSPSDANLVYCFSASASLPIQPSCSRPPISTHALALSLLAALICVTRSKPEPTALGSHH